MLSEVQHKYIHVLLTDFQQQLNNLNYSHSAQKGPDVMLSYTCIIYLYLYTLFTTEIVIRDHFSIDDLLNGCILYCVL